MLRFNITVFLTALFIISCTATNHKGRQEEGEPIAEVKFQIDVIYGHSHGMAMTFDVIQPAVSAIVTFASPTNLSKFVKDNPATKQYFRVLDPTEEQYVEFSPLSYVSSDDPPTLIMHGNVDDIIPIIHGEIMFDALQKAGVTSEYIEFENTSHIPTVEQSVRGVAEALKWFDKYLKIE